MPKNTNWSCRKTLSDSVFSFSDLDSAWLNYRNSPIFNQGQNKKIKFVLQCDMMISVDNKLCSIFISSMVVMLAVEVYAFCHKSYQTSAHLKLTVREQFQCPVKYCSVLILKKKQIGLWTETPLFVDLNFHVLHKYHF